MAVGVESKTIH